MTDNEKLIEDAAKAIYALDPDRQAWDGDAYGFLEPGAERGRKRAIAQAAVALAVFEKAHTPTDDERGDLIGAASAAFKARGGAPDWEEDAIARDLIIRWHLRGFEDGEKYGRRTEVPEPSVEPDLMDRLKDSLRIKPQGKPSDLIQRLIDLRGDMRHNADEVATLDAAITALRGQGEPSDAQVEAAHEAFWASGDVTGGHDAIRAALRAAGVVGHVCGEPAYLASSAALREDLESPAISDQRKDSIRAELVRRHGPGAEGTR